MGWLSLMFLVGCMLIDQAAGLQLHEEDALWYDLAPTETQRERVLRAAAACPVQAIIVA